MIKYYQFINRAISKLVSIFKKKNNVLIYGPQRSFTNFFTQYIERNFFVNILKGTYSKNINFYKHNPRPKLDKKIKEKTIVFILYKEFNFWLKSLERNPMDFFEINKLFNYNISSTTEVKKIYEYHLEYYNFWIKNKNNFPNIEFVDYREMLDLESIHSFTNYLKLKYKFLSYKKIYIPENVRFSENFDKENYKLSAYQNNELDIKIKELIFRK